MPYEVNEPKMKELMLALFRYIKTQLPKGWGFTLLLFGYHPSNALFYISSGQREDMIKTMKECIVKWEGEQALVKKGPDAPTN